MIVIADDITGAAEIAGIAFARGAEVRLICGRDNATYSTDITTVIATDTRSMGEAEAAAETKRIVSHSLLFTLLPPKGRSDLDLTGGTDPL